MIRKLFWSIAMILFACSTARADDIRRVVTGLDDNNKAIVLFDSRLALDPAPGPYPFTSTNLWITDAYPPRLSSKDTAQATDRRVTAAERHQIPRRRVSAARSGDGSETGPESGDERRQ